MFHRVSTWITRYWLLVIIGWLVLAVGMKLAAPRWDDVTQDGDLAYLPPEMTSVRGEKLLREAFPQVSAKSQVVLVVERPDGELAPADLAIADALAKRFSPKTCKDLPVVDMMTRHDALVGKKLTSRVTQNGQAVLVVIYLSHEFLATDNIRVLAVVESELRQVRAAADFPEGLRVGVTGSAAVGGDMLTAAHESISSTELMAVLLVMAILILVYRAPVLVIVPLATIVVSASVAMDLVASATQWSWLHFQIFKTTKIFVIVLLFGGGTDYCLFLIARFKEELQRGMSQAEATRTALRQVAGALWASAFTTILGLAMMFFAEFGKFRNSGPVIAVCLTVTLLASLTLAPALLRSLGRSVFWPFGLQPAKAASSSPQTSASQLTNSAFAGFWGWTADKILAHPGWILITSFVLMGPLAYAGLSTPVTYNLLHDLPPSRPSVAGTHLFQRHFPAGDTGPMTVLAYRPQGGLDTSEGEGDISQLTRYIRATEGVATVRSLTEPLGERPVANLLRFMQVAARRLTKVRQTYLAQTPELAGRVTRFDVVFASDPFSDTSAKVLVDIDQRLKALANDRSSPWYGTEFDLMGATAGKRDLETVTGTDRVRIQVLVTLVVFLVLIVLLRRPVICLFLIGSVLFSYFVTIGASELCFQFLYGDSFNGMDWKVPIFLFVILVAVGEDYNIYLVTRVLEEQREHGQIEGLRRAIICTGGIITSCGVIMAGSFVSMAFGSLRGIVELGFALTLGILLDTLVVRPILVPAFIAWLAQRGGERARPLDHVDPSQSEDRAESLAV